VYKNKYQSEKFTNITYVSRTHMQKRTFKLSVYLEILTCLVNIYIVIYFQKLGNLMVLVYD